MRRRSARDKREREKIEEIWRNYQEPQAEEFTSAVQIQSILKMCFIHMDELMEVTFYSIIP